MVYYKRRRRYKARKRAYNKRRNSVTKELAMIKRKLKQRAPEMKFFDRAAIDDANLVDATSQVFSVFGGIARGTGKSDYVGDNIIVKSVQIKGKIDTGVSTERINYKFLLVLDRKLNSFSSPNSEWSGTSGVFEDETLYSMRNLDNTKRYKILGVIAKGYLINDADGAINCPKTINYYKKLNIKTQFEEGDADSVMENDICIMMLCEGGNITLTDAGLYCRIRFIDP